MGEGLTPAGDDCLVGTLAVIQRFDRAWLVAHPEIQASVRQRAWTGTTVVAREFIVPALAGHFARASSASWRRTRSRRRGRGQRVCLAPAQPL